MLNIENILNHIAMFFGNFQILVSLSGFVCTVRVRYLRLHLSEHLQLANSLFHSKIGSSGMDIHLSWLFKQFTSKSKNVVMKAKARCQRMIVYVCTAGRSRATLCNIWPLIPGCHPKSSWMPPRELLVPLVGIRWVFGVLILFANSLSADISDKALLVFRHGDLAYSAQAKFSEWASEEPAPNLHQGFWMFPRSLWYALCS